MSVQSKLSLRPFQQEDIDRILHDMHRKGRALLAHEMGLGKTVITVNALKALGARNIIILVSRKHAFTPWLRIPPQWGMDSVELLGNKTPDARRRAWQTRGIKLITLQSLLRDLSDPKTVQLIKARKHPEGPWDAIVIDESHRIINRKSKLYKAVRTLQSLIQQPYILELTGTPMRRGPQDLWTQLHLLEPKVFTSYWRFAEEFTFVVRSNFGTEIFGVRNKERLKQILRRHSIRRKKADVASELPPKIRERIPVELEYEQHKLYKTLDEENLVFVGPSEMQRVIVAPTNLSKVVRLRQMLLCPKLLDEDAPWGSVFSTAAAILEELGDNKAIVFSPFAEALPLFEEYLRTYADVDTFRNEARPYRFITFRGGLKPEEVVERERLFRESERAVALCSIDFSESFSLETASVEVFLGSSWDVFADMQAEDRGHRLDSTYNRLLIYYLYCAGTVDERVFEVINSKWHTVKETPL